MKFCFIWPLLVCAIACVDSVRAQPDPKKVPREIIAPLDLPLQGYTNLDQPLIPGLKHCIGLIDTRPYEPPLAQFSLAWTKCQVHRSGDYSPIQLTLNGTIDASSPNLWRLTAILPQPNAPLLLYFVEDIFGNTGPAYGSNIPLTWEIALDGGPFAPMTLLPDNTLTATFPPGPHTFQVRITGTPVYHQADGYYHLQLTQCLVPQL